MQENLHDKPLCEKNKIWKNSFISCEKVEGEKSAWGKR